MKKTETKSTVLLKHHLKALKLPTMHGRVREGGRAGAPRRTSTTSGFLLQLCELELIDAGAAGGPAAAEGGAVPDGQDARRVRLRGPPRR